jgi:hypothetical protein
MNFTVSDTVKVVTLAGTIVGGYDKLLEAWIAPK